MWEIVILVSGLNMESYYWNTQWKTLKSNFCSILVRDTRGSVLGMMWWDDDADDDDDDADDDDDDDDDNDVIGI